MVGAIATLVITGAGALAYVADDRGTAFVTVLAMVVTSVVAILLAPDATRRLVGVADRRSVDARADLLEYAQRAYSLLALHLPPTETRAEIQIAELLRVRTRSGRSGSTADLGTLYDEAAERLVLVGAPGAGKSTAAIALYGTLLERARADGGAPVPVLLRLSSWPPPLRRFPMGEPKPMRLEEWLVSVVVRESRMRRSEVEALWPSIVPILDGLDEVPAARRLDCARAIGQFVETYAAAPLVVCVRQKEFAELPPKTTGSIPALSLEPLAASELAGFFQRVDADHWQVLVSELTRPRSELAAALSTPLMVAVTLESWGDDDPTTLVSASMAAASPESVRLMLWDRWIQHALRRARRDALSLAVALARTAEKTGASELRIESLGSRATRAAWYAILGAAVVAVSAFLGISSLVVGPYLDRIGEAYSVAVDRLSAGRSPLGATFVSIATGCLLVLLLFGISRLPISGIAAAVCALVVAALMAWTPVEIRLAPRLARTVRGPFKFAAYAIPVLLVQAAVVAALVVGRLHWPIAFAVLVALVTGELLGLDFAGHQWLARGWYRAKGPGGPFPGRLRELADAGFLRTTGDAYRFFHLELQRHLAAQPGEADAYRLENLGGEALFQHAYDRSEDGDYAGALVLWDRVLRVDPRNYAAVCNRGNALRMTGRGEEALKAYGRAVRLRPRDPDALSRRALVLAEMGETEKALGELDHALQMAPENARAVQQRGEVLRILGAFDEALRAFDRALTLGRDDAFARRGRAETLRRMGRLDEARVEFDAALGLEPGNSFGLLNRARVLIAQGDLVAARRDLDRALESDPEDQNLRELSAEVEEQLRERPQPAPEESE